MTRNLLTIIIPVRREEESIGTTIRLLSKTVQTPYVILIADDTVEPDDKTIEVVENIKHHTPILFSKKRKGDVDGFGPALVRAAKLVTTPYTVIVMADVSDDPSTIDRMVGCMKQTSCDVVCGCRYMPGGKKIGGPVLQGLLSACLNRFLFSILRFPTRDATNAFKLYDTSFLQSILPDRPMSGVEFSLQLTMRAVIKHARMIDIPTIWHGRKQGESKVRLLSRGPNYIRLVIEAVVKS